MLASSEGKNVLPGDLSTTVSNPGEATSSADKVLEDEGVSQAWEEETTEGIEAEFVSVAEVYEIAAAIGKDFEALIDRHGSDVVCGLMPKIIHVLEELEEQAAKRESQLAEVVTLKAAVERLEAENIARAQQRLKDEQDTLKIEENWRAERAELQNIVKVLTEENAQLTELIEATKNPKPQRPVPTPASRKTEESLLRRLRDVVDTQKIELRSQRRILTQRTIDFDAMKLQAERLAHLNAKGPCLRLVLQNNASRVDEVAGGMAAYLADELRELQIHLRAKRTLVEEIKNHIGPSSANLQDSCTPLTTSFHRELNAASSEEESKQSEFVKLLNTDDKILSRFDRQNGLSSPSNSPRFSYEELRQILIEIMKLESKVIQFQDQLEVYRRAGDEEPPVQGPINREPFDKADSWMKPSLTIKLIFEKLVKRLKSRMEKSSF